MAQKRGIAVISEVTLTAGILVIAVVTFLVTGNVTESEGKTFSQEQQREFLTDLTDRLERVALENQAFTSLVYNPPVRQYKIVVENSSVLTVKIPGVDRGRTQLQSVTVQNTVLQDDNTLCISGSSGEAEITAGACSRIDMATFCANGRCAGNNQCDKERGETCNVDDCSCPGSADSSDASDICQVDYTPGSYMPDSLSGTGTVEPGCVTNTWIDVQGEEEQCQYSFECQTDLQCSKTGDADKKHCCPEDRVWNGTHCKDFARDEGESCTTDNMCRDDLNCNTEKNGGDKFCCPGDRQWDGTQCVGPAFDVAFVPVQFEDSEADKFTGIVNNSFDYFKSMEPWNSCSSPNRHVNKHWISSPYQGTCNIDNCEVDPTNGVEPSCFNAIKDCAEDQFDDIQKIVGVCNNEGGQCDNSLTCGQAEDIGSKAVMTFDPCAPSQPSFSADIKKTIVHELGHALDFWHISTTPSNFGSCRDAAGACFNTTHHTTEDATDTFISQTYPTASNAEDCDPSNSEIENFHMTYCSLRNKWGPEASNYLTNQQLDQFLWGSCP